MTAPPVAPPRSSGWTLTEAIGLETLQAIQDAFALAFGIPTVIVDRRGRNVTEITHRVAFCEDLTRPSRGGPRCTACDADAMRRAESTRQPAVFRCWNHLYDCAIPIMASDGQVFGHFLCGQIRMESEPTDRYRVVARQLGLDEDAYEAAAAQVRVVARADFERSVQAMGVLARMIADQASASMQNLAVLEQALEANTATDRLTRELDTIVEASGAIATAGSPLSTLERIADSIGRVVPCDSCIIFELEAGGRRLRPLTVRDPYADVIADWRGEVGVGIPGLVAKNGTALRIDDAPADPRFAAIPGVPIEPEAILAVPMMFNGEVTGVITVSRFRQRTFSDHELDLLKILAAQSAIALATAMFRGQVAQRIEAERAQAELAHRIAAGGPLPTLLEELLTTTHRLLDCSGVALRMDDNELTGAARPIGISLRSATKLSRAHASERERARAAARPVPSRHDGFAMLVAPVEAAGRAVGELLLLRPDPFSETEVRLAGALAQQVGAATENARVGRSRRRLQVGYTLLAELGAEIASSRSSDAILDVMARRAHELIGGDAGFVATVNGRSEEVEVCTRRGGRTRRVVVPIAGRPRLRLPEVSTGDGGYREDLFDAWGLALAESLSTPGATAAVTAPLRANTGQLTGAVVVVGGRGFSRDAHTMLAVLAHTAAAGLAARRAERETDNALRSRADGLTLLTELAQRVTAGQEPDAVATAALSGLRVLTDVRGAALVSRRSDLPPEVRATVGLSRARAERLVAELSDEAWDAVKPVRMHHTLAVPLLSGGRPRGLMVAARPLADPDDGVLMALGRYGAIALDNAERLEAEGRSLAEARELHRESIAQAGELERSLAIQRALSEAVLDRRGIASVTETLARLQGGRVTIYDADLSAIAGFPDPPAEDHPIAELLARQRGPDTSTPLELALAEGQALVAAPIQAEGELLGWVVQRLSHSFGDVDRAAVAHAATAVALAMLRTRTAEEVEARMRAEFLQSLFAGEASPEELVQRGRALTYDLTQPSRVVVVAADSDASEVTERLYREAVRWARAAPGRIFVAKRDSELTLLGPGLDDWPRRLHTAVVPTVGSVLVGVGPVADAPANYRRSFLDARQCVRVLRALGRDGVLSLEDGGLEQLLVRATDADVLISFTRRYIYPLAEQDQRRRSSLVQTLELVFEHGWNLRAAARAAHVHVSTLRYRLSRVESIVGVDLSHPEDRLALQLALHTSRLLIASGRSESLHEP
jgi:GAF domain-containing protein/ligand-binding sensor protein